MRIWPLLCLALLAGCTQAVPGTPAPPSAPSAPSNLALVDVAATDEVLTASRTAVEAVFSFDPADPAAQAEAAGRHLTGLAEAQVVTLLGPVRDAGARVVTKVADAAVAELSATSARVLLMLDQTSTRVTGGQTSSAGAAVLAVAQRDGGTWRLAELVTSPSLAPIPPSPGGPVAEARDSALAAARSGLATLMGLDGNDVDGSLQRQLAVVTEPLLTQLREAQPRTAQTLREQRTQVTVAPDMAIAAKVAEPNLVTGLALVKSTVTTAGGAPAEKVSRLRFDLIRLPEGWKIRALEQIPVG